MGKQDYSDYKSLFLKDVPMLDVRAQVEFEKGSFPNATSLPLLNNGQREVIGIEYKQNGQDAAIALGYQLATDEIKQSRTARWISFVNKHPDGCLFCFRGGLRSQISQQWLAEVGIDYPRIVGGYKAMRQFLLEQLDIGAKSLPFIKVAGKTGVGKTELLDNFNQKIDLENLAQHRGSSFGSSLQPQPSQINFENALANTMMKIAEKDIELCLIEDESHLIGRCAVPPTLRENMAKAPLVIIEESINKRVDRVLRDYVYNRLTELKKGNSIDYAFEHLETHLLTCLNRIRRRLGGLRHKQLSAMLTEAVSEQKNSGDLSGYRPCIEVLLLEYYDPMYEYQLDKSRAKILKRGPREYIENWLIEQLEKTTLSTV